MLNGQRHPAANLRTMQQNATLHALLGALGIDKEAKADLVHQFTLGRGTSSADMRQDECERLIKHLQKISDQTDADKPLRMRRKMFALAHSLDWETEDGKVDEKVLLGWLMKYGRVKKHWNDMTIPELARTLTQMEHLVRNLTGNG